MQNPPVRPARFLRHRHLIAALVAVLIVVFSVTGFVWAQKGITLVVDGDSRYVKTQADTVGTLLEQADVVVGAADIVTPSADTPVADGMTVVVRHAVPVMLRFGGEAIRLNVVGSTVADALVAAGLDPGRGISVTPALDAPLTPELVIEATDVFVRVVEEQVEIPFEVTTRNDSTLPQGSRTVEREGEPGLMLNVYRVLVTGGVEGTRTLTAEEVLVEPVDETVLVGTKRASAPGAVSRERATPVAGTASPPADGENLTVVATGYSSQDPGVGSRTATGAQAVHGVMAVDPSVIPLGTRVYIPGYGNAVAADTGGAISGSKIDLCFNTRAEALSWGRRTVTITILP
ncbi:MAG: 3D domain-containing protein [Anaerosomatales bacterium]|nr:3D domain-containing protein [Anaerosomatales bacterium]MDT8433949.1 3D domain-containing protein [Anaerosomatales bacterium]